ncbi:MAG: hypothetical protein KF862_10615 [Chitinophagaceae bacterium]|nr:hypothetical protein [Chitinophagaceae bacterium]
MNFLTTPFLRKAHANCAVFIHQQQRKHPHPGSTGATVCKRLALLNIAVLWLLTGNAQFYYTDILLTGRNAEQWKRYKANRVKHIRLFSYEASGEPSEQFTGEVTVSAGFSKITTVTGSPSAGASWLTAFYLPDGKLSKSVDSSLETVSTSTYTYNAGGMLAEARSVSATVKGKDQQAESHIWIYNGDHQPQKMLWIKNGTDTSIVQFKTDERGNVIEEQTFSKGIPKNIVYYYYDDENRLTDIVRYNDRLKKLMPDNIFEYNGTGQVSQMLSIQNGNDYLIWRYEYDNRELKIRELCYNKQKRLLGKIEYQYELNN